MTRRLQTGTWVLMISIVVLAAGCKSDNSSSENDEKENRTEVKSEDEKVTDLIQALKHKDMNVRWQAAREIGSIAPAPAANKVLSALIEALKDEHRYVRSNAAWALGRIGSKEAVPALKKVLNDESEDVRKQADTALKVISGKLIYSDQVDE